MKTRPSLPRPFIRAFSPILAALLIFLSQGVNAQNWNVADGNWNLNTNWNPTTVPTAGDTARVNNGGLLNITDSQAAAIVHIGYTTLTVDNRLVIASTGTLTTTGEVRVGYSAATVGTVTVDGSWIGSGTLYALGSGLATFTINDGGSVSTSSMTMGTGSSADGDLVIAAGGSLTGTAAAYIGFELGSQADVTVNGTWSTTGNAIMAIGNSGSGTLTIGAGGVVNASSGAGLIELARGSTSASGVLTIGGRVNGVTPTAAEGAGILNAAEVRGRASGGTSTVNFNHTGADYHFTKTGLSGGAHILISGATTTVNVYEGQTSFNGANTYGGGTTINGGTLLINNATDSGAGTGSVIVEDGGTLGGSGAFTGALIANAGSTVAPGTSIQSLGAGSITIDGATFEFELNTTTSEADLLFGGTGSTLTLLNTPTLNLVDLGSNDSLTPFVTKFTLISYNGAWNGGTFDGFGDDTTFGMFGNQWLINYDDDAPGTNFLADTTGATSFVTLTVVPEPSSLLLLLGATALVLVRRRR